MSIYRTGRLAGGGASSWRDRPIVVEETVTPGQRFSLVCVSYVAKIWVGITFVGKGGFSCTTSGEKFSLFRVPPFHSAILEPYFNLGTERKTEIN